MPEALVIATPLLRTVPKLTGDWAEIPGSPDPRPSKLVLPVKGPSGIREVRLDERV